MDDNDKKVTGKEIKKYSPKYFKSELPEWKRIKDPITSRIFYRPISFYTATLATKLKISANTVSYFSIIIAIVACVCIMIPNCIVNIIGAICVNLWLISDCTDGNIARSVKRQPFGDFADSCSSYMLVALLGTALGINSYFNNGLFFESGNIWIVLLGVLGSTGDTLMRLIYHKYKSSERNLVDEGKIELEKDKRTDNDETNSILVRIESDFGIGGYLPIIVLFTIIFKIVDLAVLYCFAYYFFSGIVMNVKYIRKAIIKTREIENRD